MFALALFMSSRLQWWSTLAAITKADTGGKNIITAGTDIFTTNLFVSRLSA